MTQSTLSTSNVALTIEAVKKAVDSLLELFFTTHIERAHTLDDHYGKLWESARNLSQAGGKRLRPYMTILAYQAYSGASTESIMPVAAALEVLHLGLLVHDDIIDRDYIRYGTDNISGQFSKLYEPYIDDVHECRHFSDSAAILAGDLLLVGGHELIHSADLPPQSMIEASRIYNDTVFMVAGGELLDTE
jgi:geranylgeranyl diphosphate synthase type II